MLSKEEVKEQLKNLESDRIERTISLKESKIGEAVCAFSNDYPNHKMPGYIFLGVNDDGSLAGKTYSDSELQAIGGVRSNGNILPQPSITVSPIYKFDDGDVVVIEVHPSFYPPVRYNGKCFIRVGPRRAIANESEERRLSEKRTSTAKTYDAMPLSGSSLEEVDLLSFKTNYLPQAIDREILQQNHRSEEEQLASLRLFDAVHNCPTNAGILLFGFNPRYFIPGAYIQYLKFSGNLFSPEIEFEKVFSGPLITVLKNIDDFVQTNIVKGRVVQTGTMKENLVENYPFWALR